MFGRLQRPYSNFRHRLNSTMTKQQRQAAMRGQESQGQSGTKGILVALGVTAAIGATAYCIRDIQKYPEGKLATLYGNSFLKQIVNDLFSKVDSVFEPANDKLLPDWGNPTVYGAVPPGTPAPPLLVIDVEKTLIGSVHDASHGWRHVKRPGLDKFINSLSQYYEIVLFSENDVGVAQDILMHIDPEGKCHKLGSAAAELRGTLVLKRLDLMNREESRIILVDDSPESSQLFPRNTLLIKPFTNINDKTDRALLDLIPLLQAMVHDGVPDFRATFEDLGTHDAEQAAVEYKMRVSARKNAEDRKRNIGLGGLVRGPRSTEDGEDARSSIILTPAQIVGGIDPTVSNKSILGHTPVPKKDDEALQGQGPRKQGGLFAWVDKQSRDNSERNQLRMEKMNELYNKREMDKRAKEAEAAAPKKKSQDEEDEDW